MPLYENVLIARAELAPAQIDKLLEDLTTIITTGQGRVVKKEYWGLRTLSYSIKKSRKGHYAMLCIDAPAPTVHEMERVMKFNDDVLRYMTIRVDEIEEGPSAMMRGDTTRDRDESFESNDQAA